MLLQCYIIVITFVQVIAYSPLTCDTGIYQYDKVLKRVNVTQDSCKDEEDQEDCVQQCSNYTNVVGQFTETKYPGLFNFTWILNGEANTYLMKYSIQTQYGIQDRYQRCLHFSRLKDWQHQGWFKVILQCSISAYAIIHVTLKLPSGVLNSFSQSTSYIIAKTTTTTYDVNVVSTEAQQTDISSVEPISKWTTIAIVVSVIIFIAAATAMYMRLVRKNRGNADLTNNAEITTEETNHVLPTAYHYIPTRYNEDQNIQQNNSYVLHEISRNHLHDSFDHSDKFDSCLYSDNTTQTQDMNKDWFKLNNDRSKQSTESYVPIPSHLLNQIISINLTE